MYFPFCLIMLCLLAVSIGSEIQDGKSAFLSNSLALWGFLEMPAILALLFLAVELEINPNRTTLVYIGAAALDTSELAE